VSIGSRIKALRMQLEMSQPQLAAKAGVGQSTVSKYESDQVDEHRMHIIIKLAGALQTLPEYLYTGKGAVSIGEATSTLKELQSVYMSLSADAQAMLLAVAKTMEKQPPPPQKLNS
jgi:transcriptional regulator with XRE-family HTH domain